MEPSHQIITGWLVTGWWWLEPIDFILWLSMNSWEFHDPNWRAPSFIRGVETNHQPESDGFASEMGFPFKTMPHSNGPQKNLRETMDHEDTCWGWCCENFNLQKLALFPRVSIHKWMNKRFKKQNMVYKVACWKKFEAYGGCHNNPKF